MINDQLYGIDRYYVNRIIDEVDPSKVDLLITNLPKKDIEFGSDEATARLKAVSINIFLGNTELNADDIEDSVTSFFYANKWQCTYNSDWNLDPETNEPYITLHFQQRSERKIKLNGI